MNCRYFCLSLCGVMGVWSCVSPKTNESTSIGSYKLIWSDEFDYQGQPDSSKWAYDLGDACDLPAGCGWGNHELQYYTDSPENVNVEDGTLRITLRKDTIANSHYSSTRLKTMNKGDW